ncbi:MAG: malectin domain-containing carbohydrate-binding protein [Planctomycetota bacterium]
MPVLSEGDEPAKYTVRLYFAELEDTRPGGRVFDVKLQGKTVLPGFDLPKEAGGTHKAVVKEFPGIRVTGNLEIELVPNPGAPGPILSGVEILAPVSLARR